MSQEPSGEPARRTAAASRRSSPRRARSSRPAEPESASSRKQLVENELLEHATRLFAERGFAGTSLQDIATAAGLTRPALYYYVNSKEDLLDKLIIEATSGPARNLIEIGARQDLDAAVRLHAMAHWIVEWVVEHSDRFLLLMKSEADLSPASAQKFTEGRRLALDAVKEVIEEGIASGAFRRTDPRVAAFGVWGLCNWVAWWYRPDGPMSPASIADELADMAVEGLRKPRRGRKALSVQSAVAALRNDLERLDEALAEQRRAERQTGRAGYAGD